MNQEARERLKELAEQIVILFSENNITIHQAKIILSHTERKLDETIIHQKYDRKS